MSVPGLMAKGDARKSLMDWVLSFAIFGLMMVAVRLAWSRFPHPNANGGLMLGAVAVAATLVFFSKSRAALPIWPRALGFAATVLIVQSGIQAAASLGLLTS